MDGMRRTALLLKSVPPTSAEDRYGIALRRHQHNGNGGMVVSYLSVLQLTPIPDAHEHAAAAIARLLGGDAGGNSNRDDAAAGAAAGAAAPAAAATASAAAAAIIVTSPRASAVLAAVLLDRPALRDACVRQRIPCYVVGTATAAPLLPREDGSDDDNNSYDSDNRLVILGADCGSAANLVKSVLPIGTSRAPLRAVFLCGNTRRDTVPRALDAADHVTWEEVCVYRSNPVPPDQLHWPATPPDWTVFFSPRGVRAVVPGGSSSSSSRAWPLAACRHAAIGDTTAQAMRDAGVSVDTIAQSPGPIPLADAIRRRDAEDDNNDKSRFLRQWPWRIVSGFLCGDDQEKTTAASMDATARLRLVSRQWLRLTILSA